MARVPVGTWAAQRFWLAQGTLATHLADMTEVDPIARLNAALEGRYRIERELGAGGMATVYLAEDLKHRRRVAVKVLSPDLSRSLGKERFLREVEVAANLRHPHILPLFDSGQAADALYYVMPHVAGESLRARLDRERQLPVEEAIRIAREIADALAHAHGKGVTHRDVKPSNVLLEEDHAVLADFGIATAVGDAGDRTRLTQTGTSLGTPLYMSPEQVSGDGAVDGRSDQYSLGCVLYEMLAGRPPFQGSGAEVVVRQHLSVAPPPITEIRPSVPAAVARTMHQALAKSPADRFRSTTEFAAALVSELGGPVGSGSGEQAGLRGRTRSGGWRAMRVWGLLVGLVASVAAALVFLIPGNGNPGLVEGRVVVAVFENRTGDTSLDPLGQIAADRISQGLMQTRSLRVVPSATAFEVASEDAGSTWGRLSEATGAGLVVTGEYYLRERLLEVQAHVVDARAGSMLSSPPPAEGPLGSEMEVIEEARGRIMSALAAYSEPDLADVEDLLATPPTWDAYLAYVRGVDAWKTGSFGHDHFVRAAELDPRFVKAALMAGWAGAAGPDGTPVTDSLLGVAEATRGQLSEGDQALLDWTLLYLDRDPQAALRAFRAVEEVSPSFPGLWEYLAAWTALWANHPREALRHFEGIDADRSQIVAVPAYWGHFAEAHHRLGNLDAALEVERRSIEYAARPGRFGLDVPAARGDVATVLAHLEDQLARGGPLELGDFPRLVAELRVHGHGASVPELVAGAESLLDAQPPAERNALGMRRLRAGVLYAADRLEEARTLVLDLTTEFPDDVSHLTYGGVLAASLGDRAEAERTLTRLAEGVWANSQGFDSSQSSSAAIAAHLGNLPRAMAFLRQARADGAGLFLGGGPHAHPLLQPLWDYPDFQEFIQPEG